ncbi:MAG: DNA-processing protein DprA [Alphaproteobacteria bacterium]
MNLQEKIARLRLYKTNKIGPVNYNKLMARFGSAVNALENLNEINGRYNKAITPPSIALIEDEMAETEKAGIQIIVAGENDFPEMLTTQSSLPPVIYAKGNVELLNKKCFSIVGARNASPMAERYAFKYSQELGKSGLVIVSGMARGIDGEAHKGALDTGTIAVLGSCVNIPYPKENAELYEKLCAVGCVISEMPLGTKPNARLFAQRNRIIAGLSLGTLVVEAEIKSGSLITAGMANDMGRDVFAIPSHPTDSRGRGCNKIIKDGTATLVEVPDDVLNQLSVFSNELNYNPINNNVFSPDEFVPTLDTDLIYKTHNEIIKVITTTPMDIDNVIRQTNIPANVIKTVLLELELAEIISYTRSGLIQLLPSD